MANRRRTDSHDDELGKSGAMAPNEIVEEEPLHIHRLFIRGQFAHGNPTTMYGNDGMIDYPSEINSVIFLEQFFIFLYDNRLYRSGYYDNYQYPTLVTEDRIVSITTINEKMNQVLVLYEYTRELAILVFVEVDVPYQQPYRCTFHRDHTGFPTNNAMPEPSNQTVTSFQQESLNYCISVDFQSYIQKYDVLVNANALNGNQHASPLQENYSINMKYFSQFSIIVLACHPVLESYETSGDGNDGNEEELFNAKSKSSHRYFNSKNTSKILEITINDNAPAQNNNNNAEDALSLLTAVEVSSISTQFLHNESIYTVWNGFDDISSKMRIFVATTFQDNVIYLWHVRLSDQINKVQHDTVDDNQDCVPIDSFDDDDPNEIFEEDEREAELAELTKLPNVLVGEEVNENNEDGEDDDDDDEDEDDEENDDLNEENEETKKKRSNGLEQGESNQSSLNQSESLLNSTVDAPSTQFTPAGETIQVDDQSTLIQENRKLVKIKTKHKAWITALSENIPPSDSANQMSSNNGYVASGDKLGSIALYYFSSKLLHPNVDSDSVTGEDGDQSASRKKRPKRSRYDSKQGPWKVCDFRHNVTGQHAITLMLMQPCYRDRVPIGSKLFVGDQGGKVTILEISQKTNKMHILQVLSLFSSFGALSSLSISSWVNKYSNSNIHASSVDPNASDDYERKSDDNNSIARVRCYSADSGEAMECLLCPNMASIFKLWPESILQENIGKDRSSHSSRFDSTVYKALKLIDQCFILIEKNIVIVCDFTKQMHIYDLRTGVLLLSMTMSSDKCTCLLGLPFIYSIKRPNELGQPGKTHSLEQWMNFANQQLQGLQDERGITVVSGHKTGEIHIYHVYFPSSSSGATSNGNDQEFDSLMAGSSKTSHYHMENPTNYTSQSSQLSGSLEESSAGKLDDDCLSSSQGSNDDEAFDLLNRLQPTSGIPVEKNGEERRDSISVDSGNGSSDIDVTSGLLHMKHHHHYIAKPLKVASSSSDVGAEGPLESGSEGNPNLAITPHPYYEVVQTLRPSPLHVTDLFFSSTGQFLVSIHLKRFVFTFCNDLHYKSLRPMIEEKLKLSEVQNDQASKCNDVLASASEDKKKAASAKTPQSSTNAKRSSNNTVEEAKIPASSRVSKKAPICGPNVSSKAKSSKETGISDDDVTTLTFPKEKYKFIRHVELEHSVYSITELIPALLEDEPEHDTMNTDGNHYNQRRGRDSKQSMPMNGIEMEKEVNLENERLILIISGPDSAIINLLDAIHGNYLVKLPLPTIPLNLVNPLTSTVTVSAVQSRVRSGLIWDFPIKGSKERALVGLCPTTNPDQYLIFNESHGFKLLHDQNHMALIQQQAFTQQAAFSNSYHSSWQRDQLIGLQGFTIHSSPIVTAWSNYHCLLLRIQLHHERGVLMMRSKHYFTHNFPHGDQYFNHASNRIIAIKPLKKSAHIRNHRVLVVLSNGYGIVLHL